MSWFDPPSKCPDIVCAANFAFNPFILVGLIPMILAHIILTSIFGMDKWAAFDVVVLIYFIVIMPIIVVAGLWYAYIYTPRKWYDDWHKEHQIEAKL